VLEKNRKKKQKKTSQTEFLIDPKKEYTVPISTPSYAEVEITWPHVLMTSKLLSNL